MTEMTMNFLSNWKRVSNLASVLRRMHMGFSHSVLWFDNACSTTGFQYCSLVGRYLKLSILSIQVYKKFHDHLKLSILNRKDLPTRCRYLRAIEGRWTSRPLRSGRSQRSSPGSAHCVRGPFNYNKILRTTPASGTATRI